MDTCNNCKHGHIRDIKSDLAYQCFIATYIFWLMVLWVLLLANISFVTSTFSTLIFFTYYIPLPPLPHNSQVLHCRPRTSWCTDWMPDYSGTPRKNKRLDRETREVNYKYGVLWEFWKNLKQESDVNEFIILKLLFNKTLSSLRIKSLIIQVYSNLYACY